MNPRRLNEEPIPDESRTLRALRLKHLDTQLDRQNARIALETGAQLPDSPSAARATLPGDNARLRGIPVVGVRGGYGGAISGTRPDTA